MLHRVSRRSALSSAVRHQQGVLCEVGASRTWAPVPSAEASFLCRSRRWLVTADKPQQIKRFYKETSVKQVSPGGWVVMLDDRVLKTPRKSELHLPSEALARALAEEWGSQEEKVNPHVMPLMTLSSTAVDLVRPDPGACITRMLPYLAADTVCFEEGNEHLAELQKAEWGPLREWFEEKYGVKLDVARGLGVPQHPEGTEQAVGLLLAVRDEWELCALEVATQTAKSLVVASGLLDRADTTPEEALRWALLEEFFQIERWGLVEGEHDVSHSEALRWLAACQHFIKQRRQLSSE